MFPISFGEMFTMLPFSLYNLSISEGPASAAARNKSTIVIRIN